MISPTMSTLRHVRHLSDVIDAEGVQAEIPRTLHLVGGAVTITEERLRRGITGPFMTALTDLVDEIDAHDVQAEAYAEEACIKEAQRAAANSETVACLSCSGCERGEALLLEMEEERIKEIERSAAADPDEDVRE